MGQRLLSFILNSKNPFSLLFDESTTMANETVLILYVRALDPAGSGIARNVNWRLPSLATSLPSPSHLPSPPLLTEVRGYNPRKKFLKLKVLVGEF